MAYYMTGHGENRGHGDVSAEKWEVGDILPDGNVVEQWMIEDGPYSHQGPALCNHLWWWEHRHYVWGSKIEDQMIVTDEELFLQAKMIVDHLLVKGIENSDEISYENWKILCDSCVENYTNIKDSPFCEGAAHEAALMLMKKSN